MDYGLTRLAIGARNVAPISEADYFDLAEASSRLLEALFLEEKFDLVIENFLELETELLDSSARYMVQGDTNYAWFQVERNLINRRLVNLLTVCRAYLDFARRFGKQLFENDSAQAERFDESFGRHFDATLGYRVMEAMRNYAQHRGFPIHAIEYEGKIFEAETRNRLAFGVSVFTKTSYLRKDGCFKSAVLDELEALGGRVDVKPLFRDYVACITSIHGELRAHQKSLVQKWESRFNDLEARFRTMYPDETTSLAWWLRRLKVHTATMPSRCIPALSSVDERLNRRTPATATSPSDTLLGL